MRIPPLRASAALLLAACASGTAAPDPHGSEGSAGARVDAPPRGTEPLTNDAAIVLYLGGADALFADPRDAGLRRAFGALDDRLIELAEHDATGVQALELLGAACANPLALELHVVPGPVPLRGQLTLFTDDDAVPGAAAVREAQVRRLLRAFGLESGETPVGRVEHALLGQGADARVVVALGGVDRGALGLGSLDLPQGVEPALAFHFDLASLGELLRGFAAQSGMPQGQLEAMLALAGLGADGDASVSFGWGTADGVGYGASRYRDYAATATASGMLVRDPIEAAEIARIPRDAVSAQITQMDPAFLLTYLRGLAPAEEGDPVESFAQMTGVHLERDVFDHLGSTVGWYTSESTGGGGLFSAVAFLEVENEDELRETLAYAMQTLDDLGAAQVDGRVAAREWMHGEAACTSLVFPGIPIPVEPSFTVHEGFLLAAITPQALAAAIDQAGAGDAGLAANPRFQAGVVGSLDDLAALTFYDTARRIQDGYGLATLVFSALANGVRAPGAPARDPGLVLPPYHELAHSARATVALSRLEGDDLVQLMVADPSIAANATALCGSPIVAMVGLFAGVGGMLPMIMMSRSRPMAFESTPYGGELEWNEEEWSEEMEGLGYLGDDEVQVDELGYGGDETTEEPAPVDEPAEEPVEPEDPR